LDALLRVLEDTLPLHDIHLHLSNDLPVTEESEVTDAELEALARRMIEAFRDQPDQIVTILERLPATEPFSRDPDRARRLAERLKQ